jgi:hypothetical protein
MTNHKIIWIKWLDASFSMDIMTPDEFDTECILETVGFLAKDENGIISIALEYREETGVYRHVFSIPHKYIIEKHIYEPNHISDKKSSFKQRTDE